MRFRQLLILIVLLGLALLTNAQTSPNFGATRTALAQQTQIRQGTRFFPTPAEFLLTVSAEALISSETARALATPTAIPPTFEAQIVPTEPFPTEIPDEVTALFGDSVLPLALLLFFGVLVALGVLGWLFFNMNKQEQKYTNRR